MNKVGLEDMNLLATPPTGTKAGRRLNRMILFIVS